MTGCTYRPYEYDPCGRPVAPDGASVEMICERGHYQTDDLCSMALRDLILQRLMCPECEEEDEGEYYLTPVVRLEKWIA